MPFVPTSPPKKRRTDTIPPRPTGKLTKRTSQLTEAGSCNGKYRKWLLYVLNILKVRGCLTPKSMRKDGYREVNCAAT